MNIKQAENIKTQDEARQFAVDWQYWQSSQSLSYKEVWEWNVVFAKLAKQYHLELEFVENGII